MHITVFLASLVLLFRASLVDPPIPSYPSIWQSDYLTHYTDNSGSGTVYGHSYEDFANGHNRGRTDSFSPNYNTTSLGFGRGYVGPNQWQTDSYMNYTELVGGRIVSGCTHQIITSSGNCTNPIYQGVRMFNNMQVNAWQQNCTFDGVFYEDLLMFSTGQPSIPVATLATIPAASALYLQTYSNFQIGGNANNSYWYTPPTPCPSPSSSS